MTGRVVFHTDRQDAAGRRLSLDLGECALEAFHELARRMPDDEMELHALPFVQDHEADEGFVRRVLHQSVAARTIPGLSPVTKAVLSDLEGFCRGVLIGEVAFSQAPQEDEVLERLASLEHDQWVSWSQAIASKVDGQTAARWASKWVPYEELSQEAQEEDREWARQAQRVMAGSKVGTHLAVELDIKEGTSPAPGELPHVTVLFFPKVHPKSWPVVDELLRVAVSRYGHDIDIHISGGVEYFEPDLNHEERIAYVPVSCSALRVLHDVVSHALWAVDINLSQPYSEYLPHLTLGHLPPGQDFEGDVPSGTWTVGELVLHGMGGRRVYPLTSSMWPDDVGGDVSRLAPKNDGGLGKAGDFKEEEHPRDEGGKFSETGGHMTTTDVDERPHDDGELTESIEVTIGSKAVNIHYASGTSPVVVDNITNILSNLPEVGLSKLSRIEVLGKRGDDFKVGKTEFVTAGHYDAHAHEKTGTVRIFDAERYQDIHSAAILLGHEVGHARWRHFSDKVTEGNEKAQERVKALELPDYEADRDRTEGYKDRIRALRERRDEACQDLFEKASKASHDYIYRDRYNEDEVNRLKKARQKARFALSLRYNKYDRDIKSLTDEMSRGSSIHIYEKKKDDIFEEEMPHVRAMYHFMNVSEEEGGLTGYSETYRALGAGNKASDSFSNENFAEFCGVYLMWKSSVRDVVEGKARDEMGLVGGGGDIDYDSDRDPEDTSPQAFYKYYEELSEDAKRGDMPALGFKLGKLKSCKAWAEMMKKEEEI